MIIMLETDVDLKIQFDGNAWHVWVLNRKIGPPRTKTEAAAHLKWLKDGALQDMLHVITDIVEQAFDERERKNGNK